jgi:hypothetical protein
MGLSDFMRSLFGQGAPATVTASSATSSSGTSSASFPDVEWARTWEDQIKWLVYPYDLIPGKDAEAAFLAAQERGRIEGFSPLVLAPGMNLVPDMSRERLMAAAEKIIQEVRPASEFFDAALAQMIEDHEEDPDSGPGLFDALRPTEPPANRVDGGMSTPTRGYDETARIFKPFPEVALVRVPTANSWEIPAYFLFGDWNGNPVPAQMVSVAKYWHERYGAVICGIGEETLEFRVARKPATHQEAVALVREHYWFCQELELDQTFLEDLAADLQVSDYWLFWWD